MPKYLRLATDKNVHADTSKHDDCHACLPGFPITHHCERPDAFLHAEYRINMEAGITDFFRLERCQACDEETFTELKGEERAKAIDYCERRVKRT